MNTKKNGSGSKSEYDKENKITFLKMEKEIVGIRGEIRIS